MLHEFVAVRMPALAVLIGLSGPAPGAPMEREADEWWWLHHECKMMESRDGRELSSAEHDKACAARNQLFKKLQENGYCYDYIELEMVPCADIKPD